MANRLLIKGGRLLDPAGGYDGVEKEILAVDGIIDTIADRINAEPGTKVLFLTGEYVSPGFIDMHTHVYTGVPLGVPADSIGIAKGVTTVIDAGSAGPENIGDFIKRDIDTSITRVFSAMHYAKTGLLNTPEADDEAKYDLALAAKAYEKHKEYIVAIKARASNSCTGRLGIQSIKAGKELSSSLGLPLLVHIGNMPPAVEEVLAVLRKGDIVTHGFHGKNNSLFADGRPKPETEDARTRGVCFDIGHGKESFSFETVKCARTAGFDPDVISTDLHIKNADGPVYSLAVTIDKLMALGYPLASCVNMVTRRPANCLSLEKLGRLEAGCLADFTVFTLKDQEMEFEDSTGGRLTGRNSIDITYAVIGGMVRMNRARQKLYDKIQTDLCVPDGIFHRYRQDMEWIFTFLENRNVCFEESSALAFASHIISLFMRLLAGETVLQMEESALGQLDPVAVENTRGFIERIEQEYGKMDFSEMLLAAIHVHTAMEIMSES